MLGTLRLTPARGKILTDREITDFVYLSDWGRPAKQRTVVKLKGAPSSYIVIVEYKGLQRNSIARACALVSGDVSKEEAAAAYLEGLPDKVTFPMWWPNIHVPQWTADHPELGYRKLFRIRSDGSVLLQVGMYPVAAAQLNAGTTKP